MEEQVRSLSGRELAARIAELRALDTVDTCRMRLLTLRARIEGDWPLGGGNVFRRGRVLGAESQTLIAELLVALPTPLPLNAGDEPEAIISDLDTDLRAVAGRAVDAALALLDGGNLETTYPGQVSMFESHAPGALEPMVVSQPTVGLLIATIIGTLEAISETINDTAPKATGGKAPRGKTDAAAPTQPEEVRGAPKHSKQPPRARRVPRI